MTYLILNLLFLITLIMFMPKSFKKPPLAWWITLGGLVLLTAVFDPIIIALNIVDYDPSKILGLYLLVHQSKTSSTPYTRLVSSR